MVDIDAELARRLVASQFPRWAGLPVRPVERGGVDNRTFRLGDELTVRLPAGPWYAQAVAKEQEWLPRLAPALPLPIPEPVARGVPGLGYPFDWSVYRWLDGTPANAAPIADLTAFATDLAGFLVALRSAPAGGAPGPGEHNFHRGGPLTVYEAETYAAIARLDGAADGAVDGAVDGAACRRVWERAVAAAWTGRPVWFHGDVATGNLLLRGGRLGAVIDFGTSGVGDPACDVVIAWTLFEGASRAAFRAALGVDEATWLRGQGWAVWKALISLDPECPGEPARVLARVLAD